MQESKDYEVKLALPENLGGEAIAKIVTQVMDQHKNRQFIVLGIDTSSGMISIDGASGNKERAYTLTLKMTPA